jgi:hypothetical protein
MEKDSVASASSPTSRARSRIRSFRRDQHSLQPQHRGAVGADPRAGDGAGILVQILHAFFARKAAEIGFRYRSPVTTRSARCSCRRKRRGER